MSITTLILLSLLSAICSSDITMIGQFMISRPIFVGGLFGFILGDIYLGLWIGMIVEMMWVNEIPMGSAVPVDLTMMTILTIVWTSMSFSSNQEAAICALALAVPFAYLYRELDLAGRMFNTKIMHWVEQGIENKKEYRISQGIFLGIFLFILRAFVAYLVLFIVGDLIFKQIYSCLSTEIILSLKKAWFYLPIFGFGLVIYNFKKIKFPDIKK